jgi:hypothetical protein
MPCKGNQGTLQDGSVLCILRVGGEDFTFTMFISNRTARVLALIVSNISLSTSPVGNGVGGGGAGEVARGVLDAKSRGIGGSIFALTGVCAREGASSVGVAAAAPFSSADRVPSARIGCVCEETLKKEEEPLLGLVASVVLPDGRLGNSLSFSLSAVFGRSLLLKPNDNLDVFFAIDRRGGGASLEPDDPCLRCPGLGVGGGSCTDVTSMEGKWIHSKPPLVSRYWTCIRSSTRLISALSTGGDFVDVVATLDFRSFQQSAK